jgi:hypothetical protein
MARQDKTEVRPDPLAESRELEEVQANEGVIPGKVVEPREEEAHLILTRSNITLLVPGVFRYHHDGALSQCKTKHAFHGEMAANFGIRVGDLILCSNKTDAIMVVVPE